MMSAPPMGERPGGSSWASAATTPPGRPTPFHSALTTAAQHSASAFVASGSWRAALALSQHHIEARNTSPKTPRQNSMLVASNRQDALRLVRPVVQARRKRDW
jgi:hypothetical protein